MYFLFMLSLILLKRTVQQNILRVAYGNFEASHSVAPTWQLLTVDYLLNDRALTHCLIVALLYCCRGK